MIRTLLAAGVLALTLAPAHADEADEARKQAECRFQGVLIGAVQQARLDRVRKDRLTETLVAANPDWPEGAARAIPAIGEYVYAFSRRELRGVDLGESTRQQCLDNWEQLQELRDAVSN